MRLVIAILVVVFAADARADHAPPLVSWRAPAGCGDEAAIRARIMARAGRSVADGKEPYAIVEVAPDGDRVAADIALTTPHAQTETRRRRGSCDEVADAVVALVAMAWTSSRPGERLLAWHAPDECTDRLEVRAAATDRAHRTRVDTLAPFATVEVVHGEDYVATIKLEVRGSVETREVRGASCAEVADAVAWMIALAWPPEPPHADPPPPPPPPPPALPPPPSRCTCTPRRAARSISARCRASTLASGSRSVSRTIAASSSRSAARTGSRASTR